MNLTKSFFTFFKARAFSKPLAFVSCSLLLLQCKPSYDEPQISVEGYKIEGDFDLKVIASEPFLKAPVAIDFDSKGRIWAVEMTGYMQNIQGSGEEKPMGTIKILEDLDEDGVIDHSKIILDSLVMPRALALVYGGLLYAEPPNLWFAELDKDKVVHTVLVDSLYAADGNPEHQANGLLLHLDNWIYNAASSARYQKRDGKWRKEATSYRGQWGISKDNFGRLYYNNNATQLLGDYMLPNQLLRNKFFVPKKAVNQVLTPDQKVYPAYTSYVNRGYQEGVLDADSLLVDVTSACAPLVYRGGDFGEGYENSVFVCIPEINAIKRNTLHFDSTAVTAKQGQIGQEFLVSKDRGFRPVNLSNGPDGSLYLVDMHRGVIQHFAFLSPYLRNKSIEKQFDSISNGGRILKISKSGSTSEKRRDLNQLSDVKLLQLLKHKNGWLRDRAQHILVYRQSTEIVSDLEALAKDTTVPLAQLHALYTLKGLDKLSAGLLFEVSRTSQADVSAHGMVLLEHSVEERHVEKAQALFQELLLRNNKTLDLHLIATLGVWASVSQQDFMPLLKNLTEKYGDDPIFQEALLSGSGSIIEELAIALENFDTTKTKSLQAQVAENIARKKRNEGNSIFEENPIPFDSRTSGSKLFSKICASCHLNSGEGVAGLAPPLINSELITNKKTLGSLILYGLKGPVHVNGELVEFNAAMPGLAANETISDKDIKDLVSYVTNAFSDTPQWLSIAEIKNLRDRKSKDQGEYTEEELLQISAEKR